MARTHIPSRGTLTSKSIPSFSFMLHSAPPFGLQGFPTTPKGGLRFPESRSSSDQERAELEVPTTTEQPPPLAKSKPPTSLSREASRCKGLSDIRNCLVVSAVGWGPGLSGAY